MLRTACGVCVTLALATPMLGVGSGLGAPPPLAADEPAGAADAFWFFGPHIRVTADDLRVMESGRVVVRTVAARDDELAVFAAGRLRTDGAALEACIRDIEAFKRGPFVHAIRRFSDPPRIEDLDGLALDDDDLEAIRKCRPGGCKIKLGGEEIAGLRQVVAGAGEGWRPAVQAAFRRLVFGRVVAYLERGHGAIAPYRDHPEPDVPSDTFARILAHSGYLARHVPDLAAYLARFPETPPRMVTDSFLYWSKEKLSLKAVIGVTHVVIARPNGRPGLPVMLVATKQVFGTHYANGSLGLTVVLRHGERHYLAYVNRSIVDGLEGFFGALKRSAVERRMRSEMEGLFATQRNRLEAYRAGPTARWAKPVR